MQDSKATIFLVLELARGGELFDRIKVMKDRFCSLAIDHQLGRQWSGLIISPQPVRSSVVMKENTGAVASPGFEVSITASGLWYIWREEGTLLALKILVDIL